jgi:fibro-slime domain-containing protein
VIDLGGLHGEVEGTVDLDTLGLTEGEVYARDIFHAERRHDGSHFRIETSIECFLPPAG